MGWLRTGITWVTRWPTIAGFGPEESRLRALAGPHVRFAGSPSDEELRELYVALTRGRATNEAFVVLHGEETPADVVAEVEQMRFRGLAAPPLRYAATVNDSPAGGPCWTGWWRSNVEVRPRWHPGRR